MKRILLFLSALFIATTAIAHTINWYVDGNIFHTTTCESGENVTPPTAPEKYGYTFRGWETYTQIEYLESTKTQYIDTHYKPNAETTVEIEAQFLNINKLSWIFGSRPSSNSNIFALAVNPNINQYIFGYNKSIGNNITPHPVPDTEKHIFKLDKGICSIDDETIFSYNQTAFQSENNLYLFANNDERDSYSNSNARIFKCLIYDNNILIRDFIPVLDKNGVPCMYDKVENKFYYNAGTGDFIAGPIIGE